MRTILFALTIALGLCANSQAGFFFNAGTPSGLPGSVISVDLFVKADSGDSFNSLSVSEFILNASPVAGGTKILGFTADSGMLGNFLFPNNVTSSTTQLVAQLGSTNFAGAPATLNQVRLGSLSLEVGTAPTTVFTFNDGNFRDGANVVVSTSTGNVVIDSQVFGSPQNSFSVTAVPEPSSLALLGLVGLTGAGVRYVRNRKAKAATAI